MATSTVLLAFVVGLAAPAVSLPAAPIESYLLTKEAGPFMILAHTFRGPNSERYAQSLAIELRLICGQPTYVLRSKDFSGRGHIDREEVAVLVGDEKTIEGSEQLLRRVKKIHPATLERLPAPLQWRRTIGLSRAIRTTNPYIPISAFLPRKTQVLSR